MSAARITYTAIVAMLVSACEPAGDPAHDPAEPLDDTTLARLAADFPRLQDEPLPPPRPSDGAAPERVPERVAQALPQPVLEQVVGGATFYADYFEGRRTASGIPFRQNQMVAAHRAYPFGTVLRVTNLSNQRSVQVRVVDRGPFGAAARRPIIDLSRRAAEQLGFIQSGRTQVRVEVLEWGAGVRGSVS